MQEILVLPLIMVLSPGSILVLKLEHYPISVSVLALAPSVVMTMLVGLAVPTVPPIRTIPVIVIIPTSSADAVPALARSA